MHAVPKTLMTVGALGALALGASALADAASNGSQSSSQSSGTATAQGAQQQQQPAGYGGPPGAGGPGTPGGRHVGANGRREQALASDVAAKVTAAAKAKVPGGTVERVETDVDHGSPYEAHVRKADGTELEVLVDKSFTVTAVNQMGRP